MLLVAGLRKTSNPDVCLRHGTLKDLLELPRHEGEAQQIVNALSLPLGDVSIEVPPQYRHVFLMVTVLNPAGSLLSIAI
jgi:hypothetical protein